jgi:hypothetical protein
MNVHAFAECWSNMLALFMLTLMTFLNYKYLLLLSWKTIYVDGTLCDKPEGVPLCSHCCVIQTRIRPLTRKLPACSARTSESTTARCGKLWSRAGQQTDALHCAHRICPLHTKMLVLVTKKQSNSAVTAVLLYELCRASLYILAGPVGIVPSRLLPCAGSGTQTQLI